MTMMEALHVAAAVNSLGGAPHELRLGLGKVAKAGLASPADRAEVEAYLRSRRVGVVDESGAGGLSPGEHVDRWLAVATEALGQLEVAARTGHAADLRAAHGRIRRLVHDPARAV